MKRKKSIQVFGAGKQSWFGDQLLKMVSIAAALTAALAVILLLSYQVLSRSVFFQIEKVDVTGCSRTTPNRILAWSGLDVQTNLWEVRIKKLKKKLENDPWIKSADIERNWPNSLSIRIYERQAVAITNRETGLSYIDKNGVIFTEVGPHDMYDYPLITADEKIDGSKTGLKNALEFIRYAAKGSTSLPKQNISEIHMKPQGDMILFLADNPFPISLGRDKIGTKYHQLSKVLSWLYRKNKFDTAVFIDMNYMSGMQTAEKIRGRVLVRFEEQGA